MHNAIFRKFCIAKVANFCEENASCVDAKFSANENSTPRLMSCLSHKILLLAAISGITMRVDSVPNRFRPTDPLFPDQKRCCI